MDSTTADGIYPLALVIMAGGESRRMKKDKALLPVQGSTLIEHILQQIENRFKETLISVREPRKFQFLNRRLVVDKLPGFGPLMGIKTALAASEYEKNFFMACDIPTVDFFFLDKLIESGEKNEIAVPLSRSGRIEPLFAVYSKSILPHVDRLLDSGSRSFLPLFDICQTEFIRMENDSWYQNLNTEQEYETFLNKLK